MNILGLRLFIQALCLICLISGVLVMCLKKIDTYKKIILLSVFCFVITGMNLVFMYGFYQEEKLSFTLSFLGLVAGFAFHIGAENFKKEENFVYSKKANLISGLTTLGLLIVMTVLFVIFKIKDNSKLDVFRLVQLIAISLTAYVALFYFVRNLISPTNGSKYLIFVKRIDVIMIVELALGMGLVLVGISDSLLWIGIIFIAFMLLQCLIVYLVYGGKKSE